jgi:ADP-L-glycero-D-manno-heptose 6-epimerase
MGLVVTASPSSGLPERAWKQARVLVTGAAGFIGSALVWALNQRGCHDIVAVDFPADGVKRRNLEALRFREYVEPYALLDKARGEYLRSFDFVFHLGACSSTTETDAAYLRKNNSEYTRLLAEAAIEAKARFVYASSAATYGDGSAGMDDTSLASLDELQPLNLYGGSKHTFDLYARDHGWLEHIVGLKYFNVFGPNENHKGEMRSVVNKSYEQVMETGAIHLFKSYRPEYPDGEQKRDFLYVKDAVEMTLHLAEHPSAAGLFNIGSGEAHSWNELANAVFAALKREPRIEYINMPSQIRDKYQYFTQANIAKLRATGYAKPVTPLSQAVHDYVVDHLVPDRVLG